MKWKIAATRFICNIMSSAKSWTYFVFISHYLVVICTFKCCLNAFDVCCYLTFASTFLKWTAPVDSNICLWLPNFYKSFLSLLDLARTLCVVYICSNMLFICEVDWLLTPSYTIVQVLNIRCSENGLTGISVKLWPRFAFRHTRRQLLWTTCRWFSSIIVI